MISTPAELLEYMSNISYEWMDKKGNFQKEIIPQMYKEYSFMKPSEVLKYQ